MAGSGRSRLVDRSILVVEALVGVGVVSAIVGRTYGFSSTFVFLMTGLTAAFSGYVIIRMLTSLQDETLEVSGRVEDETRAALEHEKMLLLQGIKELEADAGVGKVNQGDYNHLRKTAEARAVRIIHEIREADAKWLAQAEDLVRKRLGDVGPDRDETSASPLDDPSSYANQTREQRENRQAFGALFDDRPVSMEAKGDSMVCGACETDNDADARYCIGCGRPSSPAEAEQPVAQEGAI